MGKRFVAIWFLHLTTDWFTRRRPELSQVPFVFAGPERGRMVVNAVNPLAQQNGIHPGMVVADCRAILPSLEVIDVIPGIHEKLLTAIAEWCIRYTPVASIDLPDGIILDISGCAHLWGGELPYLKDIQRRFEIFGYRIRIGLADTIGAAWAISRYGNNNVIIEPGGQMEALLHLPPSALRLEAATIDRLEKLGLYHVRDFIKMPRNALRRRFGESLLTRIGQALGQEPEALKPVIPSEPFQERLPCLEPISTAKGIEIALKELLDKLCVRMSKQEIGLRTCVFKCYRIDGNIQKVEIGTTRPSRNPAHLFKLFEIKIPTIEPALGFELFVLEACKTEYVSPGQEALWENTEVGNDIEIAELLDRIAGRTGEGNIHRYLPDEHYWPERSFRLANSLQETATADWRTDLPRPLQLLCEPELIEVTVPIPDYPPMLFNHKGTLHQVKKADGPERIEQEWWINGGLYRDYYCVEDEHGKRYWLFRSGHYDNRKPEWFLHGFFA